jgi:hypothetical protein
VQPFARRVVEGRLDNLAELAEFRGQCLTGSPVGFAALD